MHRRQYLPGSQHKVSRAQLARYNRALKEGLKQAAEDTRKRQREEDDRHNSGIRGFVNRAKRALTKPIRMPKLRSAR